MSEDAKFVSGTFWMVYDASGLYDEHVLCHVRSRALVERQYHADNYRGGKWRAIKVQVKAVQSRKSKR